MLQTILIATISEEAAATWWMRRYTGGDGWIIRNGRIRLAGTPLYDTNWLPAAALHCVIYREIGRLPGRREYTIAEIARLVGKSHHAVTDLFARVDAAETTGAPLV